MTHLHFIPASDPRVEDMRRRKRIYHGRLRVVIDGVAWINGREIPNRADVLEAQEMMDAEYLTACRC
jgi:hypothetical protein